MANPFEDENADFLVLVNEEGQHSLWPAATAVPDGWNAVFGRARRDACLEYIERSWTDMRPSSLVAVMSATGPQAHRDTASGQGPGDSAE
ncbi:MbtH family protein [Streptomyces sp. NPDC057623]|uniref:MbtH family protein n=1 Tax=Streptomyces sp. NPDC057623 TaxID=3346187 RepID=UPI0036AE04A7